jgi:hypothetical protein
MKFYQAISWVKWLNGEKNNFSKTISVLILRVLIQTHISTLSQVKWFFQCSTT